MQMTLFQKGRRKFPENTGNVKNKNYKPDVPAHAYNPGLRKQRKVDRHTCELKAWLVYKDSLRPVRVP